MSENIKSDTIQNKECDKGERVSSDNELWDAEEVPSNLEYDRQQLFAEKANTTFRELCKTLEHEQNKLSELETRRKKLQEEMLLLKAEIEEEKKSLNVNIERSVNEKLNELNNTTNISDKLTDENRNENSKENGLSTGDKEHQSNFFVKSGQKIFEEGTIE